MQRPLTAFAATAALAALTACTPMEQDAGSAATTAAAEQPRQCFYMSQVSGFNDAGPNRIYVHTGPSDVYLFETMGPCPDLNYSETIGFDQNGPGQICSGLDVDLIVPTGIGNRRCPVEMIRKLTPEEEAAM